jgi:hypothetical protein
MLTQFPVHTVNNKKHVRHVRHVRQRMYVSMEKKKGNYQFQFVTI